MGSIDHKFERPTPTSVWTFGNRWRGSYEQHFVVRASYAADTDPEPDESDVEEPRFLPNNITVAKLKNGQSSAEETSIRMTRESAEDLRDALELALDWDGR